MLRISSDPIDVDAVRRSVTQAGFGGIVTFVGCVRERADDGEFVTGLSYEAHEEMAVGCFKEIVRELHERYGDLHAAIVHRTGTLAVGDVAVAVAVAAPHRREAFAACAQAIDALKSQAPIWKKEHYVRSESRWRENAR